MFPWILSQENRPRGYPWLPMAYYKTLGNYSVFGNGWSNRTLDTVEIFFDKDYNRNH